MVPALEQLVRSSDNLLGALQRAVDARGAQRARRRAGARGDEGHGSAHAGPGDPRQRDALQGRRQVFADDYRAMTKDADPTSSIQAMLSVNLFKLPDAPDVIKAAQRRTRRRASRDRRSPAGAAATTTFGGGRRGAPLTPDEKKRMQQGSDVFGGSASPAMGRMAAAQPHGRSGGWHDDGAAAGGLTARPGASRLRDQGDPQRSGRTGGRQDLHAGHAGDGQAARTNGSPASPRTSATASATPAGWSRRPTSRGCAPTRRAQDPVDGAELEATLPKQWTRAAEADREPQRRSGVAAGTLRGWTSGGPQQAGMWFQVELPQAMQLTEIQFDSLGAGGGGAPAGRGGARRAPGPRRPVQRLRPHRVRHSGGGPRRAARSRLRRGPATSRCTRAATRCRPRTTARRGANCRGGQGRGTANDHHLCGEPREVRSHHGVRDPAPDAPAWSIANLRVYEAPTAK